MPRELFHPVISDIAGGRLKLKGVKKMSKRGIIWKMLARQKGGGVGKQNKQKTNKQIKPL